MRDLGSISHIAWDDDPPDEHTPWVPIMRAPRGASYSAALLSGDMIGVWLHTLAKRDTPCLGSMCSYRLRGEHMGRRWKGYFAAYDLRACRLVLVEITTEAHRVWAENPERQKKPERGTILTVRRMGTAANAPVNLSISQATCDPDCLPAAFDVRKALYRIWSGPTKDDGRELPPLPS